MSHPHPAVPPRQIPFDVPIGCFNYFFACMDCGQIVTEFTEEDHDGHEYYLLGDGEEAVRFLNDRLKEPLKKMLLEEKQRIMSRPATPPVDFSKYDVNLTNFFPDDEIDERVKEVIESKNDNKTDTKTDKKSDSKTDKKTDMKTDMKTDSKTPDSKTDKKTDSKVEKKTNKKTNVKEAEKNNRIDINTVD
jgi:uncharacterized protein YdaU (DUF1376 family)